MATVIPELDVRLDFDFPALESKYKQYKAECDFLAKVFEQAGMGGDGSTLDFDQVTLLEGSTVDKAREVRNRNDGLNEIKDELDELAATARAAQGAGDNGKDRKARGDELGAPQASQPQSMAEMFVESDAYQHRDRRVSSELHFPDIRAALFSTTAGWAPESVRSPRVVFDAQRPVQVTDLLPVIRTTQNSYKYMEETTFTNAAAATAEGGTKPEATLQLTEQDEPVRKIAVWIPVTDEQLEDVVGIQDYLEGRLEFMLRQTLDGQILTGSGVAPNLTGINNKSGVLSQAKGTDPTPDAVYKAAKNVRVTGRALPNAVIFHPNDWQDVRLLRTSDGVYIWGNPSEAGPMRIWGLGVVESDAQTENTAVVGDFANFSLLVLRQDVVIAVSDSHSTFFVENKQAVRAELRAAAVWLRPEAFSLVTGV